LRARRTRSVDPLLPGVRYSLKTQRRKESKGRQEVCEVLCAFASFAFFAFRMST
jgi:hypothetical protein